MAKITQLYKTPEQPENEMKDYKSKLLRHRAGQGIRFLVCAAVLLVGIVGLWIYSRNKTYETYEVTLSTKRDDILNTQYAEYNGKILKYSRDGISCVNLKNEALWSQTYNMHLPIIDVCQNSIVVADRQGNEAYIFNEQGLLTEITTLLPIQKVSVSAQGVAALLLSDGDTSWICLYDKEGTKLTETRCSLNDTGLPLSVSISSDGKKVAVSYLQIQSGSASSCMVFYNFGTVGGNFVDKIVSSKLYENTIIPRVQYLDDSLCAAISDEGLLFYEGKEIPEEKASVQIEEKVRSVFFGEKRVGIVVDGTGEESKRYEVRLYGPDGNQTFSQGTDLPYTCVKLSGDSLILYGEMACEIYSNRGVLKYEGSFEGAISDIFRGASFRKYVVVFSDRTEEIKLK